jgi:hypothetical protein
VTEGKGEPSEKGPGLFNYLWNQVKFIPFSIETNNSTELTTMIRNKL